MMYRYLNLFMILWCAKFNKKIYTKQFVLFLMLKA